MNWLGLTAVKLGLMKEMGKEELTWDLQTPSSETKGAL
jgi:hypothetical protein